MTQIELVLKENKRLKIVNEKMLEALKEYQKYYLLTPDGKKAERALESLNANEAKIALRIELAINQAEKVIKALY